jgi:alpha-L-fucosidase
MADGTIPAASVERLHGVGAWMKVNGEAIYGTTASPGPRPRWGRMTTKAKPGGHLIYLHVFDWPHDGILSVPLHNDVSACTLLADPSRSFIPSRTEDGVEIRLTGNPPDKDCTVIALDIAAPPVAADLSIRQAADGSIDLLAENATVHNGNYGKHARIEADKGVSHIGNWHDPRASAAWSMRITEPGRFSVEFDVAAEAPGAGFSLDVGGKKTAVKIPDTASLRTYQTVRVGEIMIGQAGRCDFSVTPTKDGWRPVNLRRVRLIPVETR